MILNYGKMHFNYGILNALFQERSFYLEGIVHHCPIYSPATLAPFTIKEMET